MKELMKLGLATLVLGALLCPRADAATMYSDRATWEADMLSWTDVPDSSIVSGTQLALPSGPLITFDMPLTALQVPTEWTTWSNGNEPMVLWTGGDPEQLDPTTLNATFSAPVNSFGFEMQPNAFGFWSMTLTLADGSSQQQWVDGASGAAFFGWNGLGVLGFTIDSEDDFAMGRFVEGVGAPPPGIPDAGSLTLAAGMLWTGLLAVGPVRRKFLRSA